MKSSREDRIALDVAHRPRVRDALRASLFGFGGTSWMSPRRRRVVQWTLPVAGFFVGIALARFTDRLPPGTLGTGEWLTLGAAFAAMMVAYVVFDVVVGLEMLEKRAVQADLDLARQIQQRMLPEQLPAIEGWDFAVYHESARDIGGDAYELRPLDDGRLLIAITDVAGKGAAAALLSSGVLARLRALARTGMDVDELALRLSSALVEETEPEHFATMVIAELDPRSGEFVYVNAGNHPPLLVRADGTAQTLRAGGVPLGLLDDAEYEESRVILQAGDRLVLATDGLFDADELGGVLVSDDELLGIVRDQRERSAAELADALRREVRRRAGSTRFDDLTVLVVGRI